MPAVKVGRYTLVGKLGAGAMAEVFAAKLEGPGGFSRRVAIKRIRQHLVRHPGIYDMLVTEGRLSAVLEHGSILQVYELLEEGGEFGLVMEYADTGTLQRLIEAVRAQGRTVPWQVVAAIGAELASALAYAHQLTDVGGTRLEVVHRDLSPTNILLTSSGGVKLADFGIAAARGALERGLAGEVVGKVDYMPREQALGLPATAAVDVFALGAVLYELATLQKAFPGGHLAALEKKAQRPRISGVPPALEAAIELALSDDPSARPSAGELGAMLQRVQEPLDGGLARYFAAVVPKLTPAPLDDHHAAVTPVASRPVQRTPMKILGRAAETSVLLERFTAGVRALTVVGAPGMGKSAVALHLVAAHGERWPRCWVASLDHVKPPWGLALATSRALEVPLDTSGSPAIALERLGEALAAQTRTERGVLVLDGADGFGAALRLAVPGWLEKAPHLDLLVVSNERLGFGEAVQLGPLPPGPAAELFRQHLGRPLTEEEAPALAEVVERLEGVPLAIELAAAAVGHAPLSGLLANLESGAPLASTPALQEALVSSLSRLSGPETAAFEQLSVFSGGFTLAAAAAVLELPDASPAVEVLLDRLLQRSLVRRLPGLNARFGLYEVLRAWGVSQLTASGGWASATERHARYFLHEGSRWAAAARGRLAGTVADTLLAELQNLLVVHQRALESLPMGPTEMSNALTAALALEPALSLRGPHGLLLSLLDSALGAADVHAVHPPLMARARMLRGNLLRDLGRLDDAAVDLDQGVHIALDVGDERLEALGRGLRATVLIEQTRFELAEADLTRTLELARARGDRREEARAVGQRALLALEQGQLDDALALYREASRQLTELGDRRLEAIGSGHLGSLYLELGQTGDARACYEMAVSLLSTVGDLRSTALFTGYLALVDFREGALEAAGRGLEKATAGLAEMGEARFRALFEACLGAVRAREGKLDAARQLFDGAQARLTALGETVFLEAVAVHAHHLARARGEAVPAPPAQLLRDNDVRLAWVLLRP